MRALILDNDGDGVGVDLAVRAQDAGHAARYWSPQHKNPFGEGIIRRVPEWEEEMDWAELIVLTGNSSYMEPLAPYFGRGYPIFGSNVKGAELELDRVFGQQLLKEHGVRTLPFHNVSSIDEAIALVAETGLPYAIKPWGGTTDKSLTCVARTPNDAIFMLEHWKREGKSGQLMLQEKVDGCEMGISGWFGPGGWSAALEESFEHKKFLVDDLGCNTGEMGTVIRHVKRSKLFDIVLEPVTEYLHSINYVGDCSINCIIDDDGTPWPLEFTCRLGWPDFCIRQALIQSDPLEWMVDLLHGKDSLAVSTQIAVGVLLSHGDFPTGHDTKDTWRGWPISGVTEDNYDQLHYQQVMRTDVPVLVGKEIKNASRLATCGNYTMVVTGTGKTVRKASERAYDVAWQIKLPSNLMFRTDIGKRLGVDLPKLQSLGFAVGMQY